MQILGQILCFGPPFFTVYIIELTVSWEDGVEEAYERKSLKYAELAADAAADAE